MGEKFSPRKGTSVAPGAGTYNPNYNSSKTNFPSFSVGVKYKLKKAEAISPGPQNYNVKMVTKRAAPTFGFGTSTRETGKKNRNQNPGPGAYKLNNLVSNLPKYAIPGQPEDVRFV